MGAKFLIAALLATLAAVLPAAAHHPGDDLDRVMGSKEHYFQSIDRPSPAFELASADGQEVTLADFSDQVVVLHFVYASCPDVCPLHAEKLAEVQGMINQTPMKDVVQFISITTDPQRDTPDVLAGYGPNHGLDAANWRFLTIQSGQDEGATRALAESFGHRFLKVDDGYQTHGVVTHVIDRGGRWAANFHGLDFAPVNLVLYINGLVNQPAGAAGQAEAGWWQRLQGLFD
jgi:protein SCO1/2